MRSCFLFFSLFCVFVISCRKDHHNDPQPSAPAWFTLKHIVTTTTENDNYRSRDSVAIEVDSVNNKIIFRKYEGLASASPVSTETYTYDSNRQLILFEKKDLQDIYSITRLEFVRDAYGRVVKVLSDYNRGLMARSEGAVTYDKRGDTTFI